MSELFKLLDNCVDVYFFKDFNNVSLKIEILIIVYIILVFFYVFVFK